MPSKFIPRSTGNVASAVISYAKLMSPAQLRAKSTANMQALVAGQATTAATKSKPMSPSEQSRRNMQKLIERQSAG